MWATSRTWTARGRASPWARRAGATRVEEQLKDMILALGQRYNDDPRVNSV